MKFFKSELTIKYWFLEFFCWIQIKNVNAAHSDPVSRTVWLTEIPLQNSLTRHPLTVLLVNQNPRCPDSEFCTLRSH